MRPSSTLRYASTHRLADGGPGARLGPGAGRGGEPRHERRVVEQPQHAGGNGLVVVGGRQQAMLAVGQDGRHPAGGGRDHGQTRSRTPPAPTSACCRCSASGRRCPRRRRRARSRPAARGRRTSRPASRSSCASARSRGLLRTAADQGQRGVRVAILHEAKRAQGAGDVVERLEIARRHEARPQRPPLAKPEPLDIDDVRE